MIGTRYHGVVVALGLAVIASMWYSVSRGSVHVIMSENAADSRDASRFDRETASRE